MKKRVTTRVSIRKKTPVSFPVKDEVQWPDEDSAVDSDYVPSESSESLSGSDDLTTSEYSVDSRYSESSSQ